MSDNGKWTLAFWIMTGVCVGGLTFLSTAVIANDRIRADEDTRIQTNVEARLERFLIQNNDAHTAIMCDLSEIKAKMGINK